MVTWLTDSAGKKIPTKSARRRFRARGVRILVRIRRSTARIMRRMDFLMAPQRNSHHRRHWEVPSPMLVSELSMESMATGYDRLSSSQVRNMWRDTDESDPNLALSCLTRQGFITKLMDCYKRPKSSDTSINTSVSIGEISIESSTSTATSGTSTKKKKKHWWRMDDEKRWPIQGWG